MLRPHVRCCEFIATRSKPVPGVDTCSGMEICGLRSWKGSVREDGFLSGSRRFAATPLLRRFSAIAFHR
eukprot:8655479-Alexandrium_andersonii.AAC.1